MHNERERINDIDRQVADLLQVRAALAQQIGAIKADAGKPAWDPAREAEVLRQITETPGPLGRPELRRVFTEIISACRALEQPLRVAYLGPEQTFSHLAAQRKFGAHTTFLPAPSIPDIFRLVESGQADTGVVPVENSTGGVIPETLDALLDTGLKICAEAHLPVHLSLLASAPLDEIQTLYSIPPPLAQCRQWLREHLPSVEVKLVSSTGVAAQEAAADPTGAALAPEEAGIALGIPVLATNIEDLPGNRTRFFVIACAESRPTGRDKTSVVFSTAHKAGALLEAIGALSRHGLNLTLIQSRPLRGQTWQYVFFVDFEGHQEDEKAKAALAELQEHCALLKVLGSYPAEPE
ncbi:MAG TPA: prephenate dehydratase [Armatimonadota bacterium]|jgi:chorismate mutase/prephenate dehydratase